MATTSPRKKAKMEKRDRVIHEFETAVKARSDFFQKLKDSKSGMTTFEGWCWITTMMPTKQGGYVQASFKGEKFRTLNQMAGYMVYKRWPNSGEQASHRCGHANCFRPGCIVYESVEANNSRKNCLVWMNCPHEGCKLAILVCQHNPPCTKFREGFASAEEFMLHGVHKTSEAVDIASQEEHSREVASQPIEIASQIIDL